MKRQANGRAALARTIREGIARELGLKINAHLFRHISALLYLCQHSGDYGTVRRVLGHKSVATTIAVVLKLAEDVHEL